MTTYVFDLGFYMFRCPITCNDTSIIIYEYLFVNNNCEDRKRQLFYLYMRNQIKKKLFLLVKVILYNNE